MSEKNKTSVDESSEYIKRFSFQVLTSKRDLNEIRKKIQSGFYHLPHVQRIVSEKILQYLAI